MVTITRRTAHPRRPASSPARHCHGCGRTESAERREINHRRPNLSGAQRWLAAGDLDVAWLIPAGRSFTDARFCHDCAPTGPMLDIECTECGNGPLVLLGETLPGMPGGDRSRDRAVEYLRRTGWRIDADSAMRCPGCALK